MKFSIIIPVYNIAPYIRACLDSVFAAARKLEKIGVENRCTADVEIICVDDGSTDGSGEILDEWGKCLNVGIGECLNGDQTFKHSNIFTFRVIHQPNAGVSAARNAGLDHAVGDWVWFVDGDDLLSRDALVCVMNVIAQKREIDAIRVPYLQSCKVPADWDSSNDEPKDRALSRESLDIKLRNAFVGAAGFGPLRRAAIGSIRFRNYKWLEDILFTIAFLRSCGSIAEINRPLYFYRMRPGSAVRSRRSVQEMRTIFECQRIIFNELESWESEVGRDRFSKVWKSYHLLVYFTFFGQYFDMPATDRKTLLPEWLSFQELVRAKYPVCIEWRIRIALVRMFNSGLLAKPIVMWGRGVRPSLGKLRKRLKEVVR